MKKIVSLLAMTGFIFSCTGKDDDDDDDQVLIDSEHTGIERMIIKSKLDIIITLLGGTAEDYPFQQDDIGAFYGATYTGYAAPDYGNGNTSVTATFLSSSKTGYISYNGEQYNVGDSFSVLEFFNDSHSVPTSDFYYVGTERGFVPNRETSITTNDSFFFNRIPSKNLIVV